jgi:hypothetical protein
VCFSAGANPDNAFTTLSVIATVLGRSVSVQQDQEAFRWAEWSLILYANTDYCAEKH